MPEPLSSAPPVDRPVVIAGSGRCGSTLLQSILNTNPEFLIWGEHNGFLRQIAAAYYEAAHPRFPDKSGLSVEDRIERLRDRRRWSAWDNLCGEAELLDRFRAFIRSLFADPTGRAVRWGFKEIRYPSKADDHALELMFDCFPETRLIILIREPESTIFSILSRWVYAERREGDIDPGAVDFQILAAADAWSVQYRCLDACSREHATNCLALRYEDLVSPKTYSRLSTFLDGSRLNYRRHLAKVMDTANKTDRTAQLIQERMDFLRPQIANLTSDVRASYGYIQSQDSGLLSLA